MTDDDDSTVQPNRYVNRATQMKNALLIIGFFGYILLAKLCASYGYYNTWYFIGGWGLAMVIGMFLLGPLIVSNRSPKFGSPKMGGTIALPSAILKAPAQGGWPDMWMYDPGSVRGLGIEEHKMSAKGYVWLPATLAIVIGQGDRGVNVFANCQLVQLGEHCELAPHLYDTMLNYPKYKPEIPVWVGIFPELINQPTPEQLEYFKKRCEDYGISRGAFEGAGGKVPFRAVLEEYATSLSRFRYKDMDHPEKILEGISKSQNSMIEKIRRDNAFFKSEITALQDLYKVRKELPPEPTWRDRLPIGGEQRSPEREEQEQRRY